VVQIKPDFSDALPRPHKRIESPTGSKTRHLTRRTQEKFDSPFCLLFPSRHRAVSVGNSSLNSFPGMAPISVLKPGEKNIFHKYFLCLKNMIFVISPNLHEHWSKPVFFQKRSFSGKSCQAYRRLQLNFFSCDNRRMTTSHNVRVESRAPQVGAPAPSTRLSSRPVTAPAVSPTWAPSASSHPTSPKHHRPALSFIESLTSHTPCHVSLRDNVSGIQGRAVFVTVPFSQAFSPWERENGRHAARPSRAPRQFAAKAALLLLPEGEGLSMSGLEASSPNKPGFFAA